MDDDSGGTADRTAIIHVKEPAYSPACRSRGSYSKSWIRRLHSVPLAADGRPVAKGDGDCRSGRQHAQHSDGRAAGAQFAAADVRHRDEDARSSSTRLKGCRCGSSIRARRRRATGMLEKYAVRVGGGSNHRFGLYDAVMIKDNHIKGAGGITAAVRAARDAIPHTMKIEVETEIARASRRSAGEPARISSCWTICRTTGWRKPCQRHQSAVRRMSSWRHPAALRLDTVRAIAAMRRGRHLGRRLDVLLPSAGYQPGSEREEGRASA